MRFYRISLLGDNGKDNKSMSRFIGFKNFYENSKIMWFTSKGYFEFRPNHAYFYQRTMNNLLGISVRHYVRYYHK